MEPSPLLMIVILGPTASGKSDLAIALARKFNGEVVSADSRQVYRGLDIGSGKITKREMRGVPHHLLDVASPKGIFSVARYQALAKKAIAGIRRRGKVPIVCGGTGLYIDAITAGASLPHVAPDRKLRARLEKKTTDELFAMLQKLDPRRAADIDRRNPRRLIRALEIVVKSGKPVPRLRPAVLASAREVDSYSPSDHRESRGFPILMIGLRRSPETLKRRIHARLMKRLRGGMVNEVRRLHERGGVSWRRLDDLGLEYRFVSRYLRGLITKEEMAREIERASWQYARRQMTWWRKNTSIRWVESERAAISVIRTQIMS